MALSKLGRFFALAPTVHSPAAGASADGNDSQPVAVVGGETSFVGGLTEGKFIQIHVNATCGYGSTLLDLNTFLYPVP